MKFIGPMKKLSKAQPVAIVIFYDQEGNILVQDRSEKTDALYKFGFFGGKIKDFESPKQAIVREIKEELNIDLENFSFWQKTNYQVLDPGPFYGLKFIKSVFLAPLTPEILAAQVFEGKKVVLKLPEALSDQGFSYHNKDLLGQLQSLIINKSK